MKIPLYIFVLGVSIVVLAFFVYSYVHQESFNIPVSPWSYESGEPEIVQDVPLSSRETLRIRTRHGQYRTEMLNKECKSTDP